MSDTPTSRLRAAEAVIDILIGRRLKRAREAQLMTIEDLQTLTGYDADEIAHYETGELWIPVQRAVRLSKLLNVNLLAPIRDVQQTNAPNTRRHGF